MLCEELFSSAENNYQKMYFPGTNLKVKPHKIYTECGNPGGGGREWKDYPPFPLKAIGIVT